MFYGDVKSAWKPLEMQAWLTKQSKQALSVPTHQSWFVHLCVFLCLNILSFALFSAVLYYPVISCTILWYPVLTCSILLYPVLSCTILYYPELFPTIMYTKSLQLCCICCWHSGLGVGRTLFSLCIQRRFQFFFLFLDMCTAHENCGKLAIRFLTYVWKVLTNIWWTVISGLICTTDDVAQEAK